MQPVLLWILRALAYAYLLRFPLLTAAAILGLTIAALTFGRPLLGNLLDIPWWGGLFYLSLFAFLSAWVVMITARMVLLYGPLRFDLPVDLQLRERKPNVSARQIACYGGIIAFPLIAAAIYYTATHNDDVSFLWLILEAFIGGAVSIVVLLCAFAVQMLFTPASEAEKPFPMPAGVNVLPGSTPDIFVRSTIAQPAFDKLRRKDFAPLVVHPIVRLTGRLIANIPENIGRGYLLYQNGKAVSILPGHGAAAVLFFSIVLVYVVVGITSFVQLDDPPWVPTVSYALLLLSLSCWFLCGLAFFLDRFRIPVVIPAVLLLTLTSLTPWSDYYYHIVDAKAAPSGSADPTAPTSSDAQQEDSIVLVAANGGGIQSAAWTAKVLTGLQRMIGDEFGKSLRLISAVSGGSVGAMYFVNEYKNGQPPSDAELDKIVGRAQDSSLDKIAWGLVYPDFLRLLTSFGFGSDRGRALEQSFLREHDAWKDWQGRDTLRHSLSAWTEDAKAKRRPGIILNTTIAETGQRLPLGTVSLPEDSESKRRRDQFAQHLGAGKDISITTATRLSAAFPYVSPAARADIPGSAPHVVDGGYYDNYGMASLVEWLDHELSRPDNKIKKVLVIRIHGAPTGGPELFSATQGGGDITSRGWFFQLFAPVKALLAVRSTGQLSHSNVEATLLKNKYEARAKGDTAKQPESWHIVPITYATFEFCHDRKAKHCKDDAPLSWHLNAHEKGAIEESWREHSPARSSDGVRKVLEFFGKSFTAG